SCGVGLGLDASESFGTAPGGAAGHRRQAGMSMKTILVPTESHEPMRSALATALMLAQRFDSYIEGFALRFRVNEFVAVDMAGAIPLETLREESLDEARRARPMFEAFMRANAVPRSDAPATSLPSGWPALTPENEDVSASPRRHIGSIEES